MNFDQADAQIDVDDSKSVISKEEQKKIQSDLQSKSTKNSIRFDMIIKFFQKMSKLRGVKKGNYCREYLRTIFKSTREPSFIYSIMRLILPSDDRDRGNYGLKQKGIAKVIADCIGLKKQDYQRLYHYKNPNYHQKGFGIGDFSLCVYDIATSFCKQKSELGILQLNVMLDQLALSNGNYNSVFRQIFQKCNAQQIKWIIRIILKDLKLSIKTESVLNAYHKDAFDYFNLTNSLLEVCKKFENSNVSLNDQIKIFNPIRPMLAGKKTINYFQHKTHNLYLQTKYDGQRIQAHFDGTEIKLFSRNAVNYSHVYKDIIDVLYPNIQADSCILDGQIIVLQKQTHQMVAFGQNKVVALSNNQCDMQLCYMIFDIMWIKVQNEETNMMKFSLAQRKKILESVIRPVKGKLQLVNHKVITTYDEILYEFGQSIERNQQGIMLKDPSSLYLPKQRGSSWLKLKGDYIDGLTDTLDVLIIGGFFGDKSYRQGDSNHWIDKITTFMLGVIHKTEDDDYVVYSFCKVGTGYNAQELALLREKLKHNLVIEDNKFYPKNLKPWKYSLQDKPDCWVKNLQDSIVIQIKAAQIITSDSYPTDCTLRFPRVVKIRYDKDWNECLTLEQLQQMRNTAKYTKNMKKINNDSDDQNKKQQKIEGQQGGKKIKAQRVGGQKKKIKNVLLDDFRCVQLGQNDVIKSNLFYGLQFVILPLQDDSIKRHDIERQILLNGGRISQNPLQKTNYIVADHIDFRLSMYQKDNRKGISFVRPKYVMSCIRQQNILLLTPLYLICLPLEKRSYYLQNYDRFSDSYTTYLNDRELDEILSQMSNTRDFPINQNLIKVIGVRHRREDRKSVCFGVSRLDIVKLKSHGNKIADSLDIREKVDSIIINGELQKHQREKVQVYLNDNPETILEYVEDLRAISIL